MNFRGENRINVGERGGWGEGGRGGGGENFVTYILKGRPTDTVQNENREHPQPALCPGYTLHEQGAMIHLHIFLAIIPDNPIIQGILLEPLYRISARNSNSIIDWIQHLGLTEWRPDIVDTTSI